jgi:serine/threonine protein kinase
LILADFRVDSTFRCEMPISLPDSNSLLQSAAMSYVPQIAGYDPIHRLGGGPLTSVWAAHEVASNQTVAVKVARPDCEDPDLATLVLGREARAGLTVRHPHLVRLRAAALESPTPFLVMDLLPGESLRDRLRRDYCLDAGTALWVARQTAEALAALHRAGFIHGDVKPENIRLIDSGTAMLIDLGFAHRRGENAELLEQGWLLGTPNYLAPEVCALTADADGRADVFSLGAVLFEMLTGALPYPPGTTGETLLIHRDGHPARLRDQGDDWPAAMVRMVDRLLAKRAANRPDVSLVVQSLIGLEIALMQRSA